MGRGVKPYLLDDLYDGVRFLYEDDQGSDPDFDATIASLKFTGVELMNPKDFIDDSEHLGIDPAGWLLAFPESEWEQELKSAYSRDFGHILLSWYAKTLAPGIQVDERMGDGRGRACFFYAIGERIPVAKFESRRRK